MPPTTSYLRIYVCICLLALQSLFSRLKLPFKFENLDIQPSSLRSRSSQNLNSHKSFLTTRPFEMLLDFLEDIAGSCMYRYRY